MTTRNIITKSFVSRLCFGFALALSLALSGPALAAGGGGGGRGGADDSTDGGSWGTTKKDPDVAAAETRIESSDYAGAIQLLEKAIRYNPRNADAFNLLAFSQRKTGDLESAAKNYQAALAIDPDHKGALEYQGELFLMLDQPERAQANLDRLDSLCFFGCDPYYELKESIAQYNEAKRGS